MPKIDKKIYKYFIPSVIIFFLLWLFFANIKAGCECAWNTIGPLISGLLGITAALVILLLGINLKDEKKLKLYALISLVFGPIIYIILNVILMNNL